MKYSDPTKRNLALFEELRFSEMRELAAKYPTPVLVMDLNRVDRAYTELNEAIPIADIFFAMKACPELSVIKLIASRGGFFDAASTEEIKQLLQLGITGDRISFGNTAKKERDIAYAFENGITLFVSDDITDLEKTARQAPGSRVCLRVLHDGKGALWELSEKFGGHHNYVRELAVSARDLGLIPYGIAFHVGSQQCEIGNWNDALARVKELFDSLEREHGIKLQCINIGGGLPASYTDETESIAHYGAQIMNCLSENFNLSEVRIISEPGRSLVADAGIIATEVVMVSHKEVGRQNRQVTLDIGRYNGVYEAGAFKFPLYFPGRDAQSIDDFTEASLVGPSCDSTDKFGKFLVPDDLKEGEIIYMGTTGAYTLRCGSVGFNGFLPVRAYVVPLDRPLINSLPSKSTD